MSSHLMKVLEVCHYDKNGKLLYQENNIDNIIHKSGTDYMLKVLFGGLAVPSQYYVGLDTRSSLNYSDTLATAFPLEPVGFGYSRKSAISNNFTFIINGSGDYQANTPIFLFKALGGSWSPVKNIFLTTASSGSIGYLISSVSLGSTITVSDGETISMRMGLAFTNLT